MATVAATTIRVRTSDVFVLTVLKAAGYFFLSYLAATLAWILIPALALGWVPLVVTSGSMKPAIDRGDVVLIEPGAFARRGHVVAFIGPNGAPVLHRLQDINSDGTFVTRGDANEQPDSTPVSRINGVGRLLIPGLGLLTMWLSELAPILVLLGAAGILIAYRRKQAIPIVVAVLVATVLVAVSATFVATTANAGSSVRTVDIAPASNLAATCGAIPIGADVPVSLTWTASPTAGVTTYQVSYDAAPPGGGFVVVGTTAATNFVHTIRNGQVGLNQAHTYQVRALVGPWSSLPVEDQVTISQVVVAYRCT